jgi:hypothetical protein
VANVRKWSRTAAIDGYIPSERVVFLKIIIPFPLSTGKLIGNLLAGQTDRPAFLFQILFFNAVTLEKP